MAMSTIHHRRSYELSGSTTAMALLAALAVLCPPPTGTAFGQSYTVTDLGVLPGGTVSNGWGVNENGDAVGVCDSAVPGQTVGWLWVGGTLTDLGSLGGILTQPTTINSARQIAGVALSAGLNSRAFLWQLGILTDLGTLGGTDALAWSINDAGAVVGQAKTAADPVNYHAFLWQGGSMTDLGMLPGGAGSVAFGLNAAGDIAGMSGVAGGNSHACLWIGGVITDLGTLGGSSGSAKAINSSRQVVGQSKIAGGNDHAFLWTLAGGMTDLGTFGGPFSSALDINNDGQVVGAADLAGGGGRAFIWDADHGMRNLNDLIDPEANWVLLEAVNITDAGQIVGTGTHNGQTRAYLLTPITGPTCCCGMAGLPGLALLALGLGLLKVRRCV